MKDPMNQPELPHAFPGQWLSSLALVALLAGCAAPLPPTRAADLKAARPGAVPGYLTPAERVDSLALLAPPPAVGSMAQLADEAAYRGAAALAAAPRWQQAQRDAVFQGPDGVNAFSCALGVHVSEQATPHLNMLLRRTLVDAGLATYKAKEKYQRVRPFVALQQKTCTPQEEDMLRKDGSYPSGHASLGWAWALVLTEIAPERANALALRGLAYGQSRMVCGVHWQSDVDAGRTVAAAVVAQLHGNADFRAQLGAARQEVASQRATGAGPARDCTAEARALAP